MPQHDDPLARFDCKTVDEAKEVILEPEAGLSSKERWEKETAWLLPKLVFEAGEVLDFGCGIGRLAKHIAGPVTPVTGVDISASMRQQATEYVKSPHFRALSIEDFDRELGDKYLAHSAIAVWVLQHSVDVARDIGRLARALMRGGPLYVMNRGHRAVPGPGGTWIDDGVSIGSLLYAAGFTLETAVAIPHELCAEGAYFARWRRV